jgi:mono/diheme cytochrome c family protein
MKRLAAVLLLLSLVPNALAQSPADASAPDDTRVLGMRLFNQSCRVCHTKPQTAAPQYGPVLSGDSLGGDETALRAFVANGSPRMPGFKTHFRPEEIAAIVAYLKAPGSGPPAWPESD